MPFPAIPFANTYSHTPPPPECSRYFENFLRILLDCTLPWRTLCRAVDTFADLNDRFVEFIVALHKLPDGDHVFATLPQFNNHWTEFGYKMTCYVSEESERDRKHQAQVNQHAFCAKLSTYHVHFTIYEPLSSYTSVPYSRRKICRRSRSTVTTLGT